MHVLTGKKHTLLLSLLPKLPADDFCSLICVCNDRSNWILESILNSIGEPTIEVNPVIAGSLWTWYCITHSQKIKGTTVYLFKHTVWCRSVLIKKTCKQLHGQKMWRRTIFFANKQYHFENYGPWSHCRLSVPCSPIFIWHVQTTQDFSLETLNLCN